MTPEELKTLLAVLIVAWILRRVPELRPGILTFIVAGCIFSGWMLGVALIVQRLQVAGMVR